VQRGNGCLQHVGAAPAHRRRALERRLPGRDLRAVPQRPLLIIEQHELAIARAGRPRRSCFALLKLKSLVRILTQTADLQGVWAASLRI
jgi:hypothetical protein